MPTIDLTTEEAQQFVQLLINMMINANPLVAKVVQQIQQSTSRRDSRGTDHETQS